jgi:hypothetical protein
MGLRTEIAKQAFGTGARGAAKQAPKKALRGPHNVNIGLKVGEDAFNSKEDVIKALEALGVEIEQAVVVRPEAVKGYREVYEPTVAVKINRPLTDAEADSLARTLGQEAIAQKSGSGAKGVGSMHGPNHAAWGAFDDKYFVEPKKYFERNVPEGEVGVLDWAGERYPETNPGAEFYDGKQKNWYSKKDRTAEEEQVLARRNQWADQVAANGGEYPRHYDPAGLKPVPEGVFDVANSPQTQTLRPQQQAAIDRHTLAANRPEVIQKYRDAWAQAGHDPNAINWYHVGQLYDDYVRIFGPEDGAKQFETRFAEGMATTTSGQNPQANFLSSQYGGHLNATGQDFPRRPGGVIDSQRVPSPVGGEFAQGNYTMYDQVLNQGRPLDLSQPKGSNFKWSYLDRPDVGTMDKRMSSAYSMTAPPKGAYGIYEEPVLRLADEWGVSGQQAQAGIWKGLENLEEIAKGKPVSAAEPFMETVNKAVDRTSYVTGLPPQTVVDDSIVRKVRPTYASVPAALGLAGAGALATPDEAEAGVKGQVVKSAFKGADDFVSKAANIQGRLQRGDIDAATALDLMMENASLLDRNIHLKPAEKQAAQNQLWEMIQGVQEMPETTRRPFMRTQTDVPDGGRAVGVLDDEGAVFRGEAEAPELNAFIPEREAALPFDELGELNSVNSELNMIDREMRQVPSVYHNPGLAEGKFMRDGMDNFKAESGEWRQYTPEERANYENPHRDKRMHSVAGVGAVAYLSDDAEDPGVLANPTIKEVGGRVGPSDDAALNRQRARDVIGDIPGFAVGIVRHLGGMAAGGLAAIGQAGASSVLGNPYDLDQLSEISQGVRDQFGGVSEDNEVSQAIGRWFGENPKAIGALEKFMQMYESGADKAFNLGPEAYLMYRTVIEGLGEIG